MLFLLCRSMERNIYIQYILYLTEWLYTVQYVCNGTNWCSPMSWTDSYTMHTCVRAPSSQIIYTVRNISLNDNTSNVLLLNGKCYVICVLFETFAWGCTMFWKKKVDTSCCAIWHIVITTSPKLYFEMLPKMGPTLVFFKQFCSLSSAQQSCHLWICSMI